MSIHYIAKRRARWSSNDASLDQLIREDRWMATWDGLSDLPAVPVSHVLSCALVCLYGGDRDRADVFLHRAVRNADRLISEERYLDTEVAAAGHPRNLGLILRGRVYARWLLGEPLDRQEMRRAAEHFATWCLSKAEDSRHFCDPLTMDFYCAAVRTAMIACDLDYAGELLKTKQKLRWHFANERSLWTRLIQQYPDLTEAFDIEFEAFFDRVRDPDFHDGEGVQSVPLDRDMLALETAIIREMYVVRASPHDPVDAKAVIEAVSY